jgi:organic radical activating enzyme
MKLEVVSPKKFVFADGHIFQTINGEGAMLGVSNIFFRLAGCSVACKFCDTRYNHDKIELSIDEILAQLSTEENKNVEWIWITGGEPTDQDVTHLTKELKSNGSTKKFALATSGTRVVSRIAFDFVSVSPHGKPASLYVHEGNQINLVPSLGGLNLEDWLGYNFSGFASKWVTPVHSDDKELSSNSLSECLKWIEKHQDFRLGIQAHKVWGLK